MAMKAADMLMNDTIAYDKHAESDSQSAGGVGWSDYWFVVDKRRCEQAATQSLSMYMGSFVTTSRVSSQSCIGLRARRRAQVSATYCHI